MVVDRALVDVQVQSDLLARLSKSHEIEHLELAFGQASEPVYQGVDLRRETGDLATPREGHVDGLEKIRIGRPMVEVVHHAVVQSTNDVMCGWLPCGEQDPEPSALVDLQELAALLSRGFE